MAFRKISLDKVGSTQKYIISYIKKHGYNMPLLVYTDNQTDGIGSGENSWIGVRGNMFFSFVISVDMLPTDMPWQSASIYFSCLLQQIFCSQGSKCYIKWPNDFYIKNKKLGGTVTKISSGLLYCGIGINIFETKKCYGVLDIDIDKEDIIDKFINLIAKNQSWADNFKYFMIQYQNSCENYKININGQKISPRADMLQDDGSLLINNKKEYSTR